MGVLLRWLKLLLLSCMFEQDMFCLAARPSWTQKFTAIIPCPGCFGRDAASWVCLAPSSSPLGSALLAADVCSSSTSALIAPTGMCFALLLPPASSMAFFYPLAYRRGLSSSLTSIPCPSARSATEDPGQQQSPQEGFRHRGRRDGFGVRGHGKASTHGDVAEGRAARGPWGRALAVGAGLEAAHRPGSAGPRGAIRLPGGQHGGAGAQGVRRGGAR